MRVGLIAPPWVSVPPLSYGGTEMVIDHLARGLQRAGDDVVLFATGDSACRVPGTFIYGTALGTDNATIPAEARQVVRAYDALAGCDVIHDHTVFGPLYGAGRSDVPVVTTVHGAFTDELRDVYAAMAGQVAVVAISHDQRATAPEVPVAAVIHHGIDVGCMPMGRGDGGYVAFLGRMSRDKGVHRAIRAAHAANVPLVIAAKMRDADEHQYFLDEVEPLLGDDAVYIGEVDRAGKLALLQGAVALVNPIRWHEPFGLVMIEALAVGTPVVAFAEGAAPEIVDHGVTGFIVDDVAEMARALVHVHELERSACRAAAACRFSTERMIRDHRALYRSLVDEHSADVIDIRFNGSDRHARRNATVAADR